MRTFILTVLLVVVSIASAQDGVPSYVVVLDRDQEVPDISDSTLWERALPVTFKVNRTFIPRADTNYVRLKAELPRLIEDYDVCRLLIIRGSASPEGGYRNNIRLAHGRARALVDSLSYFVEIPDSVVQERYMFEDYEGLRRTIKDTDEPYRQEIADIIERHRGNAAATKAALMRLDGGRVWRRLLKVYYPRLRAARFLLFLTPRRIMPKGVPDMPLARIGGEETLLPPPVLPMLATPLREPQEEEPWQPMINIKTNLLCDLALIVPQYGWAPTPNVSLEFLPRGGHLTAVAEYMGSGWRSDKRLKTWILRSLLLEARYYRRGGATFTGHYLSAYANIGKYDIQFSAEKAWLSKQYENTWGCGLGWGYVRRIGSTPWKWEVNAAVGYLHTAYDRYHPAEEWATPGEFYYNWHDAPEDFRPLRNKFSYLGLTRLGFSISYDLPYPRWTGKKGGRR